MSTFGVGISLVNYFRIKKLRLYNNILRVVLFPNHFAIETIINIRFVNKLHSPRLLKTFPWCKKGNCFLDFCTSYFNYRGEIDYTEHSPNWNYLTSTIYKMRYLSLPTFYRSKNLNVLYHTAVYKFQYCIVIF